MLGKRDKRHRNPAGAHGRGRAKKSLENSPAAPEGKSSRVSLKELADDYLAILENSLNGTVVVEASTGKILFANKTALNIFEYNSMGELGEANLLDYAHPDDKERAFLAIIKDFFSEGSHERYEFRAVTKSGEVKRVLTLSMPIRYRNKLAGLISLVDITEFDKVESARRNSEEKLRESERKLQTVFGSLIDGLIVTDMTGIVIDANEAAANIGGYRSAEDLIGRNGIDFITENDRQRVAKSLSATISDPKKMRSDIIEYIAQDKDGNPFYGESSAAVLRDSSGKATGMIFVTRDVTERKRMRDRVREDQEKLRTVFESISDGIAVTDALGTVTEINDSWVKTGGYDTKDELIGQNSANFIVPEERDVMVQRLMNRFETGQGSEKAIYKFLKKDGQVYDCELTVGMLHDRDGKITGLVTIGRDITKQKRSLEQLQASEERYRLLAENVSDVIWVMDTNLRFTYISPSIFQLRGYTAEEAMNQPLEEYITAESLETISEVLREELASEDAGSRDPRRTRTFQVELKRKDGSTVWTEQKVSFLYDENNKMSGFLGLTRDISERRNAEEALREREEFYRRIIEKAPDGVLIVDAVATAKYASPSFTRLLGYDEVERLGDNAFQYMHPDDAATVAEPFARMAATPGASDEVEVRLLHKNGTWRWFHVTGTNHLNDSAVNGIVLNFFDVTERRNAEEALRKSEEKFRTLTETSPDIVYTMDSLGVLTFIGPQVARYDLDPEKMVGRNFLDFIYPEDRERVVSDFEKTAASGEEFPTTFRVVDSKGDAYWIEEMGRVQRDPSGVLTGIIGVLRDVTERKKAEEAVLARDRYFRAIMDLSSGAVLVVNLEGNILDVTGGLERISGYTREKTIGISAMEFINPDDALQLATVFDEILQNPGKTLSAELRLRNAHGEWQWTECMVTNMLDNPDVHGIVAHLIDISDRKRAEEAMRLKDAFYRRLIEKSPDAILVIDAKGTMHYGSPSMPLLLGYGEDERVGEAAFDFIHPDDIGKALELFSVLAITPGSSEQIEVRVKHKDGTWRWVQALAINHLDDPAVNGIVVNLRDVTERKQAEQEIAASEKKLKQIFDTVKDEIILVDLAGNVLEVNRSIETIFGFTPEEVIGRNMMDFQIFDEEQLSEVTKIFMEAASTGKETAAAVELKVRHKDGHIVDIEANANPVIDEDGRVTGFLATLRDVSERQRAQEALQESEQKLRWMFESIKEGILIIGLDGKVIDVNSGVEDITGYAREQLIGKSGLDYLFPGFKGDAIGMLGRVIERGGTKKEVLIPMKTASGVDIEVEANSSVLRDGSGNTIGLIGIFRDVSERRRMEEEVRKSEELLSAVFEALKEGIAIVDSKDFKFIRWNKALLEISGLSDADLKQVSGLDFLLEEDRAKALDDFTKNLMGLSLGTPVYRIRLPSGAVKHTEMSISNLKSDAGDITGFVTSIRDITERIRMERALHKALDDLQRSNKDLEQFVYIASHDLQEPLRMISSYTQLLAKRYRGKLEGDADEFIGFAVDGADRMQKMINDLLTFSRVTTRGKEFEPVELEKAFSDAVDNLKIAIEENRATITHDPLPKVMADEPQMMRLMQNLIGNAIKFHGQEPPVINIGVKEDQEEWVISVKDNGIGIDKKYFDRLFVVFHRLHTREEYPGTGIGLAVCKKTVERHGGRIWVESEGEGKGSTFTFTIPKRALIKNKEMAED